MRKWRVVTAVLVTVGIAYVLIEISKDDGAIKRLGSAPVDEGRNFYETCPVPPKIGKKWTAFSSVLKSYKQYHDAQLLNTNQTLHKGSCRTLVWACEGVCSGMGARLRAMEQVFLLAVITKRVFGIYLDELNKKMTNLYLEPNQIDWYSAFQSPALTEDYITVKGSSCNSSLLALLFGNKTSITVSSQVGNVLRDCSHELKGHMYEITLKSSDDKAVLNGMLHNFLFKFSRPLLQKAEETLAALGLQDQRFLAIHLRTGFEGLSIQESPGSTPNKILQEKKQWEASMRCALGVADDQVRRGSAVFLATDSYNAKNWALEQYGRRIKTVHNATILHPDKRKSWTSEEDEFLGLWVDMVLLARSYVMVRAASGFSTFSSELCFMTPNRIYRLPACWTKPKKLSVIKETTVSVRSLLDSAGPE